MNDKPILYEDKIKDRDNEFLYNKYINQYQQLMNCQYKNKEYKNKINNLQSKIDKAIEYVNTWIVDEYSICIPDKEHPDTGCVYEPDAIDELLDILKEDE